jgi:predicted amidohydrolase
MFKLALIQMYIDGGNKTQNLTHAEKMIIEAAANHADFVLLPEAMNLGWTHPAAKKDSDEIPTGESCRRLTKLAKQYNLYICSGLVEKSGSKVYNSAVIISPVGEVILHHRKINELDIGHDYYEQGDKLNVCHTELGTLGLMICSDAFAEQKVLSQSLCYMGADVILSPSSWAVPADHDNTKQPCGKTWYNHYAPVCKKYSVWIAGVSNVGPIKAGPWQGFRCIGNSLVLDPQGNINAEGPFGIDAETIIYAKIEPVERPARGSTWADYWKSKL